MIIVNDKRYVLDCGEGLDFRSAILKETNDIMTPNFEMLFVNVCYWSIYECNNNDKDLNESIWATIDDDIIYEEDIWEIMKFFQTPKNADYSTAMEEFADYCQRAIEQFTEKA